MNWLAHLFLSEREAHFQLGNVMADALKGRRWEGMDARTAAGIELHYAIDRFTDEHPLFQRSKRRLGERGFLRGVVVDLAFDHFLTRHWERFAPVGHRAFLDTFYAAGTAVAQEFPAKPQAFVHSLVNSDRLGCYGSLAELGDAMERVDRRLSTTMRRRECTARYLANIKDAYEGLEADFLEFFPQLAAFVWRRVDATALTHWRFGDDQNLAR